MKRGARTQSTSIRQGRLKCANIGERDGDGRESARFSARLLLMRDRHFRSQREQNALAELHLRRGGSERRACESSLQRRSAQASSRGDRCGAPADHVICEDRIARGAQAAPRYWRSAIHGQQHHRAGERVLAEHGTSRIQERSDVGRVGGIDRRSDSQIHVGTAGDDNGGGRVRCLRIWRGVGSPLRPRRHCARKARHVVDAKAGQAGSWDGDGH